MKKILVKSENTVQKEKIMVKRKRCYKCDFHSDTKHNMICITCKKHICEIQETIKIFCNTCYEQNESDEDEFK